jgi:hypothetical protein
MQSLQSESVELCISATWFLPALLPSPRSPSSRKDVCSHDLLFNISSVSRIQIVLTDEYSPFFLTRATRVFPLARPGLSLMEAQIPYVQSLLNKPRRFRYLLASALIVPICHEWSCGNGNPDRPTHEQLGHLPCDDLGCPRYFVSLWKWLVWDWLSKELTERFPAILDPHN